MSDKSKTAAVAIPGNMAVSTMDASEMMSLLQTSGFLPRLQLMTANSEQCKAGEFPINHFALVNDSTFKDVGIEVDILVVGQRLKALDMSGDDVISSFDPKVVDRQTSGLFREIQDRSVQSESRCMWGPEFLVYVVSEKVFASFFMGSKSSRREAPSLMAKIKQAATLRAKKIETKKYTWFSPVVSTCSTPIEPPAQAAIQTELEKFLNPPETQVEKAPAAGTEQAR